MPTATAVPSPPASGATTSATLTSADLSTIESVYITARNQGDNKNLFTPSSLVINSSMSPRGARVSGSGEWALVSYLPASGDTLHQTVEMQDGTNTGFFFKPKGGKWLMRGVAATAPACTAETAGVPASVVDVWGWPTGACTN